MGITVSLYPPWPDECIERVDLVLHVVVFTILCENLLKIYSLPFGNVLPKLLEKAKYCYNCGVCALSCKFVRN